MQSTGVYWLPAYEIPIEEGLEVFLVNARHTKNLPGRKTDVQECQWLLQLHTFGLLNNSFRPPEERCCGRIGDSGRNTWPRPAPAFNGCRRCSRK